MNAVTISIRTVLFVVLLVVLATADYAQSRKPNKRPISQLFDEFGSVGYCDLTARLDNFAIQLQNDPHRQGFLIAYAPPGEGPGTGPSILDVVKAYLINTRGVADERITKIYGGRNNHPAQLRLQLWIGGDGAPAPEPEKYETSSKIQKISLNTTDMTIDIDSEGER